MQLDELNAKVTAAILRAEALRPGTLEAQSAFREVCTLEESIAGLTSGNDVEGEIARLGAVAAALSAGESLRALQLARRYAADSLSAKIRAKLDELVEEAEQEMQRFATTAPNVEPVKFQLRDA